MCETIPVNKIRSMILRCSCPASVAALRLYDRIWSTRASLAGRRRFVEQNASAAVSGLQKIRLGRVPAVALVMGVTIAATGTIGSVIFNQLLEDTSEVPLYRDHTKVEALRAPGKGASGRATASVKELGKELAATEVPAAPPVGGDRGRRNTPNQTLHPRCRASRRSSRQRAGVVKPFLGPWKDLASL